MSEPVFVDFVLTVVLGFLSDALTLTKIQYHLDREPIL